MNLSKELNLKESILHSKNIGYLADDMSIDHSFSPWDTPINDFKNQVFTVDYSEIPESYGLDLKQFRDSHRTLFTYRSYEINFWNAAIWNHGAGKFLDLNGENPKQIIQKFFDHSAGEMSEERILEFLKPLATSYQNAHGVASQFLTEKGLDLTRLSGQETTFMDKSHSCATYVLKGDANIVLINSHDRSASLQFMLGFYRFACSNGLIVGDDIAKFKVRHNKNMVQEIGDGIEQFLEHIPMVAENINQMSSTMMTDNDMRRFANIAARLKFNDPNKLALFPAQELLQVRRPEDQKNDVFSVFNRVQEGLIRGGIDMTDRTIHKKRVVTKPISSINESVRVNRELWKIATEFATGNRYLEAA